MERLFPVIPPVTYCTKRNSTFTSMVSVPTPYYLLYGTNVRGY